MVPSPATIPSDATSSFTGVEVAGKVFFDYIITNELIVYLNHIGHKKTSFPSLRFEEKERTLFVTINYFVSSLDAPNSANIFTYNGAAILGSNLSVVTTSAASNVVAPAVVAPVAL